MPRAKSRSVRLRWPMAGAWTRCGSSLRWPMASSTCRTCRRVYSAARSSPGCRSMRPVRPTRRLPCTPKRRTSTWARCSRRQGGSASGNVLAVAGPATIVNPKGSTDVPLDRLLEAVNPFRTVDATTELRCAVIRLPLKDGVALIDRSIAAETSKFGATASGTLDFRNETLDLSVKPQVRQGISIAVPQVAQLVHFRGSLSSPSVGIDATASAETVARLGAAVYTGGLSILGESLFAKATGDPAAPCQIALGRGSAANAAAAKPADTNPAPTESLGKAVGHLFGH